MTDDEIDEVRNLQREIEPPPDLEHRTIIALKRENLIGGSRRTRVFKTAVAIAACLALFVGGFWAGSNRNEGITMSDSTFILFLLEDSSYQNAADEKQELQRIEEYRNWARTVRAEKIPLSGVKLDSEVSLLGEPPQGSGIAGYFIVEAKTFGQAQSIARSCPHLKYGGQIEIRRIQPV